MTAGWAALNTLRENEQHFVEGPGTMIPGAALHHSEDCPGCKQDAALALVQTALEYVDHAEAVISRDPFGDAERKQVAELLAAALRAVREGK